MINKNVDLYRDLNNLRMDEKWNDLIILCNHQWKPNIKFESNDFFILGRLMEGLCIQNSMNGFMESIKLLQYINYRDDSYDNLDNNDRKIIMWINNNLWQWVFYDKNMQIPNKIEILQTMLRIIPTNWITIRTPITQYISNNYNYNDFNYNNINQLDQNKIALK
jgi:hypothetical protein